MTNQKPKPLFPGEIPPMVLPLLSIEEPADRPMPTPVPVVLPLRTLKGGTSYVAELVRVLPIKTVCQILTQIPEERHYDLLKIGVDYDVFIPSYFTTLRDLGLKTEVLTEMDIAIIEPNLGLLIQPLICSVGIEYINPECLLSIDNLVTLPTIEEYEFDLPILVDYDLEVPSYETVEKTLSLITDIGLVPSMDVSMGLPAASRVEVVLSMEEMTRELEKKLAVQYEIEAKAVVVKLYDGWVTDAC